MPSYQTPGVYYERSDASAAVISPIRTDVTGFVGIARRGPLHTAVPVQSWRQFQAYFGDFTGAGYLAYAVRAFFDNGGARCWVVRVASDAATVAATILRSSGPGNRDIWRASAFSPGVWGNDLNVTLKETYRAQTSSDPGHSAAEYSVVGSITGFARGTHVRLRQDGTSTMKVVSDVDAVRSRLIWVHDRPEARLPYDTVLSGFDANQPILIESVEYTLVVRELGRLVGVYDGLSLIPEHPRYGPRVLGPVLIPNTNDPLQTLPAAPEPIVIEDVFDEKRGLLARLEPVVVAPGAIALAGGADGLALLGTYDFVGADIDPLDGDVVKARKRRGLQALQEVDEVAILAVPDINIRPIMTPRHQPLPPCIPDPCLPAGPPPPAAHRAAAVGDLPPTFSEEGIFQVQAALVEQCERRRDRVAILDPPFAAARDDKLGVGAVRAWRSRFDSTYAAFYYPWLRVVDPLRTAFAITRDIPPCGHVAGQYAQTDFQVGVHKAPANAPLVWVQDVTAAVDDAVHGILNESGINVIRPLPGRGIRVAGARTVSSDTSWRFVNVRRLLIMIEKAIDVSTQWAVFEPNDVFTRAKLQWVLSSFLLALWQRGALMGAAANEAFFVKCDDETTPPSERDQGRLLALVGVAPACPFEFVILRVGRVNNAFEVTETSAAGLRRGGP